MDYEEDKSTHDDGEEKDGMDYAVVTEQQNEAIETNHNDKSKHKI